MHKSRSCLLLIGSLLVAGCSSTAAPEASTSPLLSFEQQVSLARLALENKPALNQLTDIRFQPIERADNWMKIEETNQVFQFESGKSYIGAYQLDVKKYGDQVTLYSPVDFTVFVPRIMVLDEQYHQLSIIDNHDITYDDTSGPQQGYMGHFSLPAGHDTLFLVVYSAKSDYSTTTKLNNQALLDGMRHDRAADVGKYFKSSVQNSPTGKLRLQFSNALTTENATPVPKTTAYCHQQNELDGLSERDFYQHISQSVINKKYEDAITWVRRAECAGYARARDVFFSEIEQHDLQKE